MIEKFCNFFDKDKSQGLEIIFLKSNYGNGKSHFIRMIYTFLMSMNLLADFWEKIKKYCGKNEINFTVTEDIRWIELQQYIVEGQEKVRDQQRDEFLEKTLVNSNFSRFMKIFKKIDRDGYFKKNFYKEVMFQEKVLADGARISVPINQVSKFFRHIGNILFVQIRKKSYAFIMRCQTIRRLKNMCIHLNQVCWDII